MAVWFQSPTAGKGAIWHGTHRLPRPPPRRNRPRFARGAWQRKAPGYRGNQELNPTPGNPTGAGRSERPPRPPAATWSEGNQTLTLPSRATLPGTGRPLARNAAKETSMLGKHGFTQAAAGARGRASVLRVLVLAALPGPAAGCIGLGGRNRIDNDRFAHRRWLFGGVALGDGAPNGLGPFARFARWLPCSLDGHEGSGDLAAAMEVNVGKCQRVPSSPARTACSKL
jgi:hypothetical protein